MHGLIFRKSIHYWQDQPGSRDRKIHRAKTRGNETSRDLETREAERKTKGYYRSRARRHFSRPSGFTDFIPPRQPRRHTRHKAPVRPLSAQRLLWHDPPKSAETARPPEGAGIIPRQTASHRLRAWLFKPAVQAVHQKPLAAPLFPLPVESKSRGLE